MVWSSSNFDVIQSKILQNLYENDVVICDLSGLNSNVMLETGLRLSTKKPTIIITDAEEKPPFDIETFSYIEYPKNLEYNSTSSFIDKLSNRIKEVFDSYKNGNYKSFVENYTFEVVKPNKISVSSKELIYEKLSEIIASIESIKKENSEKTTPHKQINKNENPTEITPMIVKIPQQLIEKGLSTNFISETILNNLISDNIKIHGISLENKKYLRLYLEKKKTKNLFLFC